MGWFQLKVSIEQGEINCNGQLNGIICGIVRIYIFYIKETDIHIFVTLIFIITSLKWYLVLTFGFQFLMSKLNCRTMNTYAHTSMSTSIWEHDVLLFTCNTAFYKKRNGFTENMPK